VSAPANFRGTRPLIEPANAAMLLIDYQSGLFQTIGDVAMPVLRANLTTLAQAATLAKIPVITTSSAPQGPSGTLIPEIRKYAPHAKYIARHGEINAWDNTDFVAAVRLTGKWQLIVAGTISSVCVALPAIAAVDDGYQVFAVADASGPYSKAAEAITLARIAQAGVVPMDIVAVCAELQQTWNREDVAQWAAIYAALFPKHQPRIESYATLGNETVSLQSR
jgi:nicotinamidase-related amidase